MALSTRSALQQLVCYSIRPSTLPRCSSSIVAIHQCRAASKAAKGSKAPPKTDAQKRKEKEKAKARKQSPEYPDRDLKQAEQFALCDAIRYIRAFEVGRGPRSPKYDLAIRLRTFRNAPVIRNRLRLPHPVDTSIRICVICPPDSKHATAAIKAGASLVGEEEIFEAVRNGTINFDRCICHVESFPKLQKANVARILGPRGLMPNMKNNTVVRDVGRMVQEMYGGTEYREREGVVRLAVGQLGFTPEMLEANITSFMKNISADVTRLKLDTLKEVVEVVLSSTSSPGFSLNGKFKSPQSLPTSAFSTG